MTHGGDSFARVPWDLAYAPTDHAGKAPLQSDHIHAEGSRPSFLEHGKRVVCEELLHRLPCRRPFILQKAPMRLFPIYFSGSREALTIDT